MFASQFPSQVIHYIYMDNDLYKAAEAGNMEEFNRYEGYHLRCLVDLMFNTAIHIHMEASGRTVAKTEFSVDFVQQLVAKSPLLLLLTNAKEEIPLHIAAANGNAEQVKFIVERTKELERYEDPENGTQSEASSRKMKEMLEMQDEEGNTPLHKAAESGSAEVVGLLMKELDGEFYFHTNYRGETPLYLASLRGYDKSVAEILSNWKSMYKDIKDYCGPDDTTALHAAVMSGDESTVWELIINTKKDFTGKTDRYGRTPLHYAAHLGLPLIVSVLLENGATAAYIRDKKRGSTPLHMAAWQGEFDLMEKIIGSCPGCCNIVDKNGWNFLHFYFVTFTRDGIYYLEKILEDKCDDNKFKDLPMAQLLRQKDINGITPYEVFSLGPAYDYLGKDDIERVSKLFGRYDITLSRYMKEKEKNQIWESLREISTNIVVAGKQVHISFFKYMENKEKEEKKKKKIQEFIDKSREAHLVVVALIATVTFAAAFTIPGGYNQDKGTAIMSQDSAFQAFLVTNTLAFVSSLSAIFLHFLLTYFCLKIESTEFQVACIFVADGLTFLSMIAMVIAFSTGSYAIMRSSLGFAIATCTLALTSIPCMLLSLYYLGKKLFTFLD